MSALHHFTGAAPMPCRSRVTGRYLPASRKLADRMDKADASVESAFDALRPIAAVLDRAAAGPLGPDDIAALRAAHDTLWATFDRIADGLDEVRTLLGVGHG